MIFRVQLEKRIHPYTELPVNPFLKPLDLNTRISMSIREWDIEAKNETEVRKFLKEAYDKGFANVRGYRLRSIEPLTPSAEGEPG